MADLGSFHGNIFVQAAFDGNNGRFNFHRQWKLPCTSMEVNILPPTSMGMSMQVNLLPPTSMEASMQVGGNFRGSRSNKSRRTLVKVMWKQLEVCDIRASRWKYLGVCGSSWKLPRNIFVQSAIDGSNGSFYFHRQGKVPCVSVEASTNFHGPESTSTNLHGNFHGK